MDKKSIQQFIEHKAYNIRVASIMQPGIAGSGHPTTCLSAADIAAVLFFNTMAYDLEDYNNPDNDRFILSKGHASALLYAVWKELGKLTEDDLRTYRQFNSVLEGHPTFRFPYTEAATGSLGIGLSIGVGEALCAKLDKRNYRVYVLLGDAESAEGSIWEAVQLAAYYKLDNLTAIIDCNRLGQSDETMLEHDVDVYAQRLEAFGWKAFTVDGHDSAALIDIFDQAKNIKNQPTAIVAKTIKGYGVESIADKLGFHGKALTKESLDEALEHVKNRFSEAAFYAGSDAFTPSLPQSSEHAVAVSRDQHVVLTPSYTKGEKLATRKAYGQALADLGDVNESIVSLDADVKNSTFAEIFEQRHPERFFQCFIAEQNMVSMGVGFDRRGRLPFISTFAAFFSRAHDQIRMAAIGQAKLCLVGSHAGVSIGQDGPSQMGLEDIALARCLPDSVVLYPSDAVSTYKLVAQMANRSSGISYLRTTRSATPVLYDNDAEFPIGGHKVLRKNDRDTVCIIAAGITLFEALAAHERLLKDDTFSSVVDLYSVKPLDAKGLRDVIHQSGSKVIVVEDHYGQGGIGEAVIAALCNEDIKVKHLAVSQLPRSGKPEELLAFVGIDADAIVQAVQGLI